MLRNLLNFIFKICVFITFFLGCSTASTSEKKIRLVQSIERYELDLIGFRDILEENIDTSFYIETRFKDKSCHFFYFIDGSIHGSFVLPEPIDKEICRNIEKFDFRGVWKYADENLYRISVQESGKEFAQILIRRSGESSFNFSVGSRLYGIERIKDVNLLKADYSSKPVIIAMSDSILVYFP